MVLIRISDEVWQVFRDSWALFGVRTHEELVHMLEEDLWDKSWIVLDDAKRHLVDHTPEAYVRREIGLEEERKQGIKRVDKKGEKSIGENLLKMFSDHPEVLQEVFPGARISDKAMLMVRSETAKASTSISAQPERAGKKGKDRKRKSARGRTVTQKQPKKRQRKPREKCPQEYAARAMEHEQQLIGLYRSRSRWSGEQGLVQRKGYLGYLV